MHHFPLDSETAELSVASRNLRQKSPAKNVFVAVAPQFAAMGADADAAIPHLCRFGEFMLNTGHPIDQVIVVLAEDDGKASHSHSIPDEFMRYLSLWSELTQTEVAYVTDPITWTPPQGATVFLGAFVKNDAHYALLNLTLGQVKAHKHYIVVGPQLTVPKDANLKSAWALGALKDLPKRWMDAGFDPKFDAPQGVPIAAMPTELPPSPFLSFAGIYFRKGLVGNPGGVGGAGNAGGMGLRFRGPNQFVCVLPKETGMVFTDRVWHMEVEAGSYMATLMRLAPEILGGKAGLSVAHRGMHPDTSKDGLYAWRELIAFRVDIKGAPMTSASGADKWVHLLDAKRGEGSIEISHATPIKEVEQSDSQKKWAEFSAIHSGHLLKLSGLFSSSMRPPFAKETPIEVESFLAWFNRTKPNNMPHELVYFAGDLAAFIEKNPALGLTYAHILF